MDECVCGASRREGSGVGRLLRTRGIAPEFRAKRATSVNNFWCLRLDVLMREGSVCEQNTPAGKSTVSLADATSQEYRSATPARARHPRTSTREQPHIVYIQIPLKTLSPWEGKNIFSIKTNFLRICFKLKSIRFINLSSLLFKDPTWRKVKGEVRVTTSGFKERE